MVSIDKVSKGLGNRLRELREEKKLSQERLAFSAGLNRAYIGYIERGERNPSIRVMAKIAKAMKVELFELFKF